MIGMMLIIKLGKFIRSGKRFQTVAIGLSVMFLALACQGQTDNLRLDFADGLALSTNVEIVNKIPKSHLKRLPESLPIFRCSGKPRIFSTNGLVWLLSQSAFAGTNIAELLHDTNWNLANAAEKGVNLKNGKNPPDVFSINPLRGDIHVENVERKLIAPKTDAVPSRDEIRKRSLKLAEMLGVKNDEMETSNGLVKVICADTETSTWSGHGMERVHFISEREAKISHGVKGYSSWLFEDKMILQYGVSNRLVKFSMHWPQIEPVRTNSLLTIAEMIGKIKKNQALTDATDISGSDVTRITLKDIEIQYYYRQPSGFRGIAASKTDIYPIAAILVTFKTKSGQTEDAGIYFPVLKPQ